MSACRPNGPDNNAANGIEAAGGGKESAARNAAIRAAAEPFEALTEESFAADWGRIDGLIASTRNSTAGIRGRLTETQTAEVDRQLAAIASARAAQDRVALALASVEGYRRIVESQDPTSANPPIAVSLLDYAGFRYDALAQAPQVDWQQMDQAVAFARDQWRHLAPSMKSKSLPGVMDSALSAMANAVEQKDVVFARSAAASELALVDLLEEEVAQAPSKAH